MRIYEIYIYMSIAHMELPIYTEKIMRIEWPKLHKEKMMMIDGSTGGPMLVLSLSLSLSALSTNK